MKPGWRLSLYRHLQKSVVEKWILPRVFTEKHGEESFAARLSSGLPNGPARKRIWFHAASVGELELLWTVIMGAAKSGDEVICTVFSESARASLEKLARELSERGARLVHFSFSPWEGSWESALAELQPSLFVTARYESWPDLWASLRRRKIPLVVVAAQPRRSFRIAKTICDLLGEGIPELTLITADKAYSGGLREIFPEARVMVAGEPRWDRVFARNQKGSARAVEVARLCSALPRPWGILGQVWPEDLHIWSANLKRDKGTLWVVPHALKPELLGELQTMLQAHGIRVLRTSELQESVQSQDSTAVLVNEMGFLSELYSIADWAFVGGGFGAGVHSTIEPAIQAIPVACGPKGTHRFQEIDELEKSGQLKIVRSTEALADWLNEAESVSESGKKHWAELATARLGATDRILKILEGVAAGLGPC